MCSSTPILPLVSADIVQNPASCIFSAHDTMANAKMVKVLGWYDNEWGYSNRLIDLVEFVGLQVAIVTTRHEGQSDGRSGSAARRSSRSNEASACSSAPTSTCR